MLHPKSEVDWCYLSYVHYQYFSRTSLNLSPTGADLVAMLPAIHSNKHCNQYVCEIYESYLFEINRGYLFEICESIFFKYMSKVYVFFSPLTPAGVLGTQRNQKLFFEHFPEVQPPLAFYTKDYFVLSLKVTDIIAFFFFNFFGKMSKMMTFLKFWCP